MRQVFSWRGSLENSAVAVSRYSSLARQSRAHFATSAQVLVLSWVSVLAVTTPLVSGQVQKAQMTIQATRADLPMPWPEATAICIASSGVTIPSRISANTPSCHWSGPSNPSSSPLPHGKASLTKVNGSCPNAINRRAMAAVSLIGFCAVYALLASDPPGRRRSIPIFPETGRGPCPTAPRRWFSART